mgnify:CR=1 FL=1
MKGADLLYLTVAILFPSCSTYEIAERHLNKKYEKAGLVHKVETFGRFQVDYWEKTQDKPFMVLINGFGASTKYQWAEQIEDLADDYSLVLPNLLYFGESKPVDGSDAGVEDQVEMITTFLKEKRIELAHVMGVSYGGLVAGEFARQHPEVISKLILFDTPLKFFDTRYLDTVKAIYNVESHIDLFAPNSHKGLKDLLVLAYYKPPKVPAFALKSPYREMYAPRIEKLKKMLLELPEVAEKYNSYSYDIGKPTLLIWGAHDDVIPVSVGEQLHEHIKGSEFHVIPKTKHMPNMERPKEFNAILLGFLSEK